MDPDDRGVAGSTCWHVHGAIFANSLARRRTIFAISLHNSVILANNFARFDRHKLCRRNRQKRIIGLVKVTAFDCLELAINLRFCTLDEHSFSTKEMPVMLCWI